MSCVSSSIGALLERFNLISPTDNSPCPIHIFHVSKEIKQREKKKESDLSPICLIGWKFFVSEYSHPFAHQLRHHLSLRQVTKIQSSTTLDALGTPQEAHTHKKKDSSQEGRAEEFFSQR